MTDDPGPRQQRERQQHYETYANASYAARCACGKAWPCPEVKAPDAATPVDRLHDVTKPRRLGIQYTGPGMTGVWWPGGEPITAEDCPNARYHGSWRYCPTCGHQPALKGAESPTERPKPALATGHVLHHADASGLWCTCGGRWQECAARQVGTAPALAADRLDPVAYTPSEAEAVHADVVRMANVGAALVYAIYHSGADAVLDLPPAVLSAYAAACKVYRVGASDG